MDTVRNDGLYADILKARDGVSALILRSATKDSDLVRVRLLEACTALSRAAFAHYNRPLPVERSESMTKQQAEVYVKLLRKDLQGIAFVRLNLSSDNFWTVAISLLADNRNFEEKVILETEEGASKFLTGLRLGLSRGERPV